MRGWLLLLALTSSAAAAQAEWLPSLRAYPALGPHAPQAQALRLEALLDVEARLGAARLQGQARFEYDPADHLEPGKPDQSNRSGLSRRWLIDENALAELEELYVDLPAGPVDLRLGKQQIVWGSSDGVKILDQLNPQSFREFLLEDFDRSRIPLWSAKATLPFGEGQALELVAIPDLSFHDIPSTDALFALTAPAITPQGAVQSPDTLSVLVQSLGTTLPAETSPLQAALQPLITSLGGASEPLLPEQLRDLLAPTIQQRTERPTLRASTVELGARLRGQLGAVEAAASVLRHFNDAPTVRVTIDGQQVDAVQRYVQTTSMGLALSRPVGGVLLRAEGVYGSQAPLPALDFEDDDLSAIAPSYGLLAGIDLPVRDAGLVSLQLAQTGFLRDKSHYQVPDRSRFITALWRDELIATVLVAEAFAACSLEQGDVQLRLRAGWQLHDTLRLNLGIDGFFGDRQGVFGQFDSRDRATLEIVWSPSF